MWLTLHFSWSVYFSIYNNVHPPRGPRLPPHITRHDAHHTHHVLRWTQTHRHVTPTHKKLQQIQLLSQLRQLLWNQLPLFRVYFPEWFVITVCVASADYIFIPYPYRVVWLLLWSQNRPTLDSVCLAYAHEFRTLTSKYIWNIFLQSHVKRQGQRITRETRLLLLLTYTVTQIV